MCGICGIALSSASTHDHVDADVVRRMRDSIIHRGPDGAGLFAEGAIGLGHRRLSIIDVAHGAQPMQSDDGRMQIIYNGEVFNHPALKQRLEADGVRYQTRCDTETVLRLYEREGTRCVTHLRGMFAFAIWDRLQRSLFLARDRFGVKPLYFARLADGSLIFGSEIKAILASGLVRARLNRRALPDYLANHAPSGNETLFEGIERLPAAHWLLWRDGATTVERYWDLPDPATEGLLEGSDDALTAEYLERFTEAVRLRLMSDVPLGMFLSGGIDSAAITAVMSRLVTDPIKTFSVAFQEREANELSYARLVANQFHTDHHEVMVSQVDFFARLPRLVWHEDEPLAHPSSVALNFVSELARTHVKVVLTGEGSDETLAGYNRYRVTLANLELAKVWRGMVPASARAVVRDALAGASGRGTIAPRLRRTFLFLPGDLDSLYLDNFAVFGRAQGLRLLSPELRTELSDTDPYAAFRAATAARSSASLLTQLLYADTRTYLQELLMKQDQMSMAASIESRVPFLDHPLAEFATRLPDRLKLRRGTTKVILRHAMRGMLPDAILTRRKMGFPVPVGQWLKQDSRWLLDEFVQSPRSLDRGLFAPDVVQSLVAAHCAGDARHDERLWALLNFEIWQRIYFDGEAPEQVAPQPAGSFRGTGA